MTDNFTCPNCGADLQAQQGFDPSKGYWTCADCGRVNYIQEDEIVAGPVGAFFRRLGFRGIEGGGKSGQEHL